MRAPITRRTLLATATAALAAPAVAQRGREITFAFAPDDSGAIQRLIDGFNAANGDGITVRWRTTSRATDAFFRELRSDFLAGAQDIDVFGADVIWTAELAARDEVRDLSRFTRNRGLARSTVPAALRSTVWRNRSWAVPWYTDAGLLYYRRDLVEAAPATWDALARAARGAMADGPAHGLVFQGDAYEGGVTNALEFIWSAGGRPWTGQVSVAGALSMGQAAQGDTVVTLDTADAAAGLARARALVAEGVAPPEVTEMREQESLEAFMAGDAVFMRNWPFASGIIAADGRLSPDQVGAAPIPALRDGAPSYSCLGGWNLAVPADARDPDAALAFIDYATRPEQQRMMAEIGGFLPVLADLYDDALVQAAPVVGIGRTALATARARPLSPVYSLLSPRLAFMFEDVLLGERDPREAVARTEGELRRILRRSDI
ncbi:MAG: extracellular solute-binding protein [Pseudomonadota bacterium]